MKQIGDSSIFNKQSATLDSKQNTPSNSPIGSWGGHDIRSVDGQSYVKTSEYLKDTSIHDDANNLEVQELNTEKKSIFAKIRDVFSEKVSTAKMFFGSTPILIGFILTLVGGLGLGGTPLLAGIGVALVSFIVMSVGKLISGHIAKKSNENKETKEPKAEIAQQLEESKGGLVKEQEVSFETTTKNDGIDKDEKDIQDPSKLSKWQKIKQKLKIAAPIILGATIIALTIAAAVTATVFTGGLSGAILIPLTIVLVCSGTMMGGLCIGKGITKALDYMDEKKAFLDSQNNLDSKNNLNNENANIDKELPEIDTIKQLNNTKTTQTTNKVNTRYEPKKFV